MCICAFIGVCISSSIQAVASREQGFLSSFRSHLIHGNPLDLV